MIGKSLAHYIIEEELGRGGMGIVYRARDMKLERTVAVKVLPPKSLGSDDDRARFQREAKAAAQIHHPHIASVFEVDEVVPEGMPEDDLRPFIAMEYVEGETLGQRIERGPLPIEDALRVAMQIASGLEAAHEKEIVHRDIKASNVMLTKKGDAKILDFGLAQTIHSTKLTRMGSTVGAIGYMSPEQAQAIEVDLRTDLWSLGVLLYEMIAGQHPFPGEYEQAIVFSILNEDPPPLSSLRTDVPIPLEWTIEKLLTKSVEERYQSTKDLMVDLRKLLGESRSGSFVGVGSGSAPIYGYPLSGSSRVGADSSRSLSLDVTASPKGLTFRRYPIVFGTAILAVLVGLILGSQIRPQVTQAERSSRRFELPTGNLTDFGGVNISPDGNWVVFQGSEFEEERHTWLNILDLSSGEIHQYNDDNYHTRMPNFSPDSKWLLTNLEMGMVKIRVPNGDPFLLAQNGDNGSWINDTSILYTEEDALYRMDENGGSRELIMSLDSSHNERALWPMSGSPLNGRYFLSTLWGNQTILDARAIIVDLESGSYEMMKELAFPSYYLKSGHIIYGIGAETGSRIAVQRFDESALQPYGPVVPINVERQFWRGWNVGKDGTFIYTSSGDRKITKMAWLDRAKGDIAEGWYTRPKISPDGRAIVFWQPGSDGADRSGDIGYLNLDSGISRMLVSDKSATAPNWTADGTSIVYSARSSTDVLDFKMYTLDVEVGSTPKPVQGTGDSVYRVNMSPNSEWIAFEINPIVRRLLLGKMADGFVVEVDTLGSGSLAAFSNASQHLAFLRRSELIVTNVNTRQSVSCCQGSTIDDIHWLPGDAAIMFSSVQGSVFQVPIELENGFRFTSGPELLANVGPNTGTTLDPVSGELLVAELSETDQRERLILVENWFDELNRIAPIE